MAKDSGKAIELLRVDGGAAADNLLVPIQADLLGNPVVRAKNLESIGLGAGMLAGLGAGMWSSLAELSQLNPEAESFSPKSDRSENFNRWLRAVEVSSKF
jgi:glycerol kinase